MRFLFFSRCPTLFLFAILTIACSTTGAAQLIRGPYLQQPSDTGIIVRWRTDSPTLSTLYYGDTPGSVEHQVQETTASKEHVISISGLAPAKRYYYSIHDFSGEIAGGSQYYFHTSPPPGESVATRIWVLGDPGDQSGKLARRVRDGYLQRTADRKTDFLLLLGDNAYRSGLDRQYQVAVFDRYRPVLRHTPVWSAIGNHEANKPGKRKDSADSVFQTGPYYDIFSFPTAAEAGGVPSETEAYYSFDFGNVHVIVLDSFFSIDRRDRFDQRMINWLKADLAENTAKWTIAAWHHSPYSKGSHDADHGTIETHMRSAILPLLEAGGVDLVLTGHSHAYERSHFLHGFYEKAKALARHPEYLLDRGNGRAVDDLIIDGQAGSGVYQKGSSKQGTVYVVAGNASSVSSKGHLDHPAMAVSHREPGSLAIDINNDRLSVSMINDAGKFRDRFSIVKNAPTIQPDDSDAAIIIAPTILDSWTSADYTASQENVVVTTPIKKLERRIAAGKYDVEEQYDGEMYIDSSDLEMVNDKRDQVIALRFNKLNLPANAVIRKAWIQFEADEKNSRETTLYIHGEKMAYSKKFTATKWDLSNRNRTDSFVTWHPESWLRKGSHGTAQRSPDITKVIQEIVIKTDWRAGNAMTFFITGKGKRVARSFEGDPVAAPLLHIEYTSPITK